MNWSDSSSYTSSSSRYESFIASVKKKFAKKRDRAAVDNEGEDINQNTTGGSAKRVFLKPQDWVRRRFNIKIPDFFLLFFLPICWHCSVFGIVYLIGCYTSC